MMGVIEALARPRVERKAARDERAAGRPDWIQHRLLERLRVDVGSEGLAVDRDVYALAGFVGDDLDALAGGLRRRSGRGGEPPDLDVAVPHAVAMVLQQDEAVLQLAEPRDVLELALRDGRAERGAVELVLQHLRAVQVVLDGLAVRDHAALIPLAGRAERPILGGKDVVERGRLPVRSDLRVGVALVVDQLVLVADGRVLILEDEVLEAAVAAFRYTPLPGQLEAVVGRGRDDVALTARIGPVAGIDGQQSIFDAPPRAGGVRLLVAAPAVERFPIEQQRPAGLLFLRRQLIDGVSRGLLGDGDGRERGRRRNRRNRRREVVTQVRHDFILFQCSRGPTPARSRAATLRRARAAGAFQCSRGPPRSRSS